MDIINSQCVLLGKLLQVVILSILQDDRWVLRTERVTLTPKTWTLFIQILVYTPRTPND